MSEVTKTDLPKVPFNLLLVREGFNIRKEMGNIEELADSIQENGVRVPLRGYKEKGKDSYIVVDGHRRYFACKLVVERTGEMIKVPFMLEPQKYNDEQRIVDMFITNDGKALTVLEKAEGVGRMLNFGWTASDIARKIGKTPGYISRLSSLNTAPRRLTLLVQNNRISGSYAMDIVAKGSEAVDKFLQEVEAGFFDANKSSEPTVNGEDMFEFEKEPQERHPPVNRITKKDAELNSWKELKAFLKVADPAIMPEDKQKTYDFLWKVLNNEMTDRAIKMFFGRSACE